MIKEFDADEVLEDCFLVERVVDCDRVGLFFWKRVDLAEVAEVVLFCVAAFAPAPMNEVGVVMFVPTFIFSVFYADINTHLCMGTGLIINSFVLLPRNGKWFFFGVKEASIY